mgnify:CR=1 FL=1
MDRPFSEEEFKAIFSRVPRLCVDLIIRSPRGIIMTRRSLSSWGGMWHVPGGTVFYRERVEDAAKRVAKRELGIEIDVVQTLGYMEFPSEEKERGYGYSVSIALLCTFVGGALLTESTEASEIREFLELPDGVITEQREFLAAHWSEIFS